jgi:hypothetical protein
MKHSYPTSESLRFLLQMIHNREMALPDFQRDFVWDPYATEELLESIISNYPAGSLLRIKSGHHLVFQPRAVEGAPALARDARPSYLILDGQQRLTSLYQALYGVGEHRYYIDLGSLEKKKDLEDCVFYLRAEEAQARLGKLEQQADSLTFPLGQLFRDDGFAGWTTRALKHRCKDVADMIDLQARLSRLYEEWIKPIEEYEFPMVTLNENTSGAAVCTIFETLNRTGVKLGVFDLLTARFWSEDLNLRKLWDEARSEFPLIGEYEIDPYYVLQIVGLLEPGLDADGRPKAPSVKRGAILDMNAEQARRGWRQSVEGLGEVLSILRDDCGVLAPWLLPYTTILIPMAAVWATSNDVKGADAGTNRLKLLQWFWCSVFGQRYENSPNSQAEKDFGELRRWMTGGAPPESVASFTMEGVALRTIRPKQRAVYRGVMALILQQGALDFHKRGRITAQLLADKRNPVDDHHIFARAYLDEKGWPDKLRDCILNRTYIDRETNRRLSRRPPSDYFAEIRGKHGAAATAELLASHFLPADSGSPLLADDFTKFLDVREAALLEAIRRRTAGEGLLSGRGHSPGLSSPDENDDEDDDDSEESKGSAESLVPRSYWENRVPPESLDVVEACLTTIREFLPEAELRYKRWSIGLRVGGRKVNFVLFRPKQDFVRVEPRLQEREEWITALKAAGLFVLEGGRRRLRFRLKSRDLAVASPILRRLFEHSFQVDGK